MFTRQETSLSNIDSYVDIFINKNISVINRACYKLYGETSKLSTSSFKEIILIELKKACHSFVNNNHDPLFIDKYLFACINKTVRRLLNEGKRSSTICPA